MKHIRREIIDAIQMTKENRDNNVEWPEWLNAAWNYSENQEGRVFPFMNFLGINFGRFVHKVEENDYIYKDLTHDTIHSIDSETFNRLYKAIEDPQ
jgi:hypothetical protein